MPRVRQIAAEAENTIIESNSVLRFVQPDVSLSVLDPSVQDFKPSAVRYLDRVDALVVPAAMGRTGLVAGDRWPGVSGRLIAGKRKFEFHPPEYCSCELAAFVASLMAKACA